ncbi:hypothetical protein CPLU01_04840 [Colletotrichum plurivorum]|uniref:Biotrophy-associated secreted protein 3 n=1 Tax=Colletotrichum plurivorum TaxID=2175906 RepID=A0A8H6KNY0_9PEZI|nr:hypothetical protein CPLU01_04840 [Colletotrichum plurivorum]
MKFLSSIAVLALAASVNASCMVSQLYGTDSRCCWGGKSGSDACIRQNGYVGCINGRENDNFCSSHGISSSKCSSDCCDIATGRGQPCPKGKNRCDDESGCPYRSVRDGSLL